MDIGDNDELFNAIMALDKKRVDELKESGITLTEDVRRILESGPKRSDQPCLIHPEFSFRTTLYNRFRNMPIEDFREAGALLCEELGTPLHYSEAAWAEAWNFRNRHIFDPDFFDVTLQVFDQKKMAKKETMKRIIDKNALGCLPVCEKHGWLKLPKTRDELIAYATENGKTEAAAWLLDFKNRTADLATERAKAEKKMQRELNADPNSVTSLKKIWRYSKLENGTLEITCYKGDRTEVIVPEKIGNDTVTAIGVGAFTTELSCAVRTPKAICEKRSNITKITLPETITYIDKQAFCRLYNLTEINIPKGVTEILFQAFFGCWALKEIKLSSSVTYIGREAFSICPNLTFVLYRGSYAERYCKENNIDFKYAEEYK